MKRAKDLYQKLISDENLRLAILTVNATHKWHPHHRPNKTVLRVEADIEEFLEKNPGVSREDIPTDQMTASGSGLDPHISPASAEVQIPRIVEASGLSEDEVRQIIADNTKGKTLGVFGEETVNVLGVNLDIALAMGLVGEISK